MRHLCSTNGGQAPEERHLCNTTATNGGQAPAERHLCNTTATNGGQAPAERHLCNLTVTNDLILKEIKPEGEISYEELSNRAVDQLSSTFDGKVVWYVVSVKLDLEARNIIERMPKTSPHRLRLKK